MEAAEDPDDAQLWWPQGRPKRHDTIPCLVGQRDGDPSNKDAALGDTKASLIFDVFAPDGSGAEDAVDLLPPTVQVHDIAVDDAAQVVTKLEQDDHSTVLPPVMTRTPWADVSDDNNDFPGFGYPDDLAEDAAAEAEALDFLEHDEPRPSVAASYHAWSGNGMATPGILSSLDHDLGTQCGQLPQPSCGTFGVSQTPQTQLPDKGFGSHDHDLGTQCGPLPQPSWLTMPSDGFEATVDPGRGRREPVVAAAAAAAAAAESLKGEAAATAAANDPDLPGSPEFLLCAGMQEEFQTHARSILPDVFPDSDEGEAFEEPHEETDLSTAGPQVASYHAWSGNGMATPGFSHASPIRGTQYGQHEIALSTAEPQVAASYHAWSGNGMATPGFLHASPISGTQYGRLPPDDDPDFFPDGGSIFDVDFCLGSQTLRTQYGPLPQQHSHDSHLLLADFVSQDQDQGTQCGPLPQDFLPDAGGGSKDSNSILQSQSPRTHCGHLPQQHALADVDSFMLQFWQEHQALVQAFNAKADAHHSSMPTFKDADNSDACMRDLTPPEFSTRLASGTQCGPLPQQHNPCGSDRSHVQLGPSYLQVAKDLNLTTPRTQCGPLPRTQTSIPPGKFKGVAGKGKGKGKKHRETEPAMASFATKHRATEPRKGRDKKTAKPLTPGQ